MNKRASDESIGQLIRRTRRRNGLSQAALAAALAKASGNRSIARAHVARWERGQHIPGPYWRGWLATTLNLARQQIERAVLIAKREKLQHRGDQIT
jgi:transcriptional regulator with XRE-family HTH domain